MSYKRHRRETLGSHWQKYACHGCSWATVTVKVTPSELASLATSWHHGTAVIAWWSVRHFGAKARAPPMETSCGYAAKALVVPLHARLHTATACMLLQLCAPVQASLNCRPPKPDSSQKLALNSLRTGGCLKPLAIGRHHHVHGREAAIVLCQRIFDVDHGL